MKNLHKIAIVFLLTVFASCSNTENGITGNGSLKIEFENGFANNSIALGDQTVPTSQNEILRLNSAKYIISNVSLINENGTVFTYPKNQSYFIVDLSNPDSAVLNFDNIPSGNYKAIKFGIGVDQNQYDLGNASQGNLWALAQAAGMAEAWESGYKFISLEGTYTSAVNTTSTPFSLYLGKTATNYNYREINLTLPTNALVRSNITPQIHLSADLAKIIDGINKISLSANNHPGVGALIADELNINLIGGNVNEIFEVEHVHNDPD